MCNQSFNKCWKTLQVVLKLRSMYDMEALQITVTCACTQTWSQWAWAGGENQTGRWCLDAVKGSLCSPKFQQPCLKQNIIAAATLHSSSPDPPSNWMLTLLLTRLAVAVLSKTVFRFWIMVLIRKPSKSSEEVVLRFLASTLMQICMKVKGCLSVWAFLEHFSDCT